MQVLATKHLINCQFAVDRYQALKKLGAQEKIAEIGVLGGDLSEWFMKNLAPKEVHMIDLYNCADFPGRDRFTKRQHEGFIHNRFENEIKESKAIIKKGISWEVMAHYPNNYFDLIYIDAGHDYNSVKKDLEASANKIKDGGYIVMNDYIMYDHLSNTKYGVVQATNEFCIKNDWEFIYYAFHPNLFCDVVLRKIN
ncbi:class I SAM-dependent methyltransferase [Fulvivirga lutea]|uniref:Class I SAM-dependent methyltransferase n=1 Tax=Fulvivirga lutea TaxID=2810512 RepID=A0A974WMX4_9BACT|nr:class I SAM-dependent methyltransferase [Fulvivirga lutea]QSE98403.1 class I SAM-dependent methyltransferase [Fulvivirga lutea]